MLVSYIQAGQVRAIARGQAFSVGRALSEMRRCIRRKDWRAARRFAGALWPELRRERHALHGPYVLTLRALRVLESRLGLDNVRYWQTFYAGLPPIG